MGKKFKNKDLAAKLGVSGTLVSLVLNNKADQHGITERYPGKSSCSGQANGLFQSAGRKKHSLSC